MLVTQRLAEWGRDVLGGSLLRCTLQERTLKGSVVTGVRECNHEEIYAICQVLAPELPAADIHAISLQP